ncbi:hypothetical protein PRK78_003722 [Emydomyces testavorans]|uniref:Secreted protein n=1 Tax=Emydomyces testavorans TaxID=2070801 RepID=A0AAF0DGJ2_9EURO|nr:hypothetical protein PRK78_003722 [Emydomyces testavorans]
MQSKLCISATLSILAAFVATNPISPVVSQVSPLVAPTAPEVKSASVAISTIQTEIWTDTLTTSAIPTKQGSKGPEATSVPPAVATSSVLDPDVLLNEEEEEIAANGRKPCFMEQKRMDEVCSKSPNCLCGKKKQ